MKMIKVKLLLAGLVLNMGVVFNANAVPVDVAFVVDQSVSMGPEFGWIPTVMGEIDTALQSEAAIDSVRYGIAGYMTHAGDEPGSYNSGGRRLAYVDLTTDLSAVTADATYAASNLYASVERGYHAADWSRTGFSWSDDGVKIMILLTDERGDQGSVIPVPGSGDLGSDEMNLGKVLDDDGFLLNVVTRTALFSDWDDAVFDISAPYEGLFSLGELRDDPDAFTAAFVAAKVGEIKKEIGVPEPSILGLLGLGLAGFMFSRRKTA